MKILIGNIEKIAEGLPEYLKESYAFNAILKAKDKVGDEIIEKLDNLNKDEVDIDFFIKEVAEPIVEEATTIVYDKLIEDYPFSVIRKDAKDKGCSVYEYLDKIYED